MTDSSLLPPSPSEPSSSPPLPAGRGNLLGLLTALFYSLFTLLPNSHTLMVVWPWVLFWQVGLLCPVFWLLGMLWQQRLRWLGHRLDWLVGVLLTGLIISAGWAPFPMPARWYCWAIFCGLAALYAVSSWLTGPGRRMWLLQAQGYLTLAFIGVSLLVWGIQTASPEVTRLQSLQGYGVRLPFDFSNLELRNWAPIGHQNYVAGYLVLTLPLLAGFAWLQQGWRRWLWGVGLALGLIDLYTTSSKGGWLGLLVGAIAVVGLLWSRKALSKRWLSWISISGLVLLLVALTNNRLRLAITTLVSGQGGESAYRLITNTIGWHMGLARPFTGEGPGSVPLLYQRYRPAWAGREAEITYQLHSTPAQVWAELGLWAVVVGVGAIALFIYLSARWFRTQPGAPSTPPALMFSLYSGLIAYGVMSLTDYQLDNLSISGLLIIILAVLITTYREDRHPQLEPLEEGEMLVVHPQDAVQQEQLTDLDPGLAQPASMPRLRSHSFMALSNRPAFLPLLGLGVVSAAMIWLFPIHRAWMLSSQGFLALRQDKTDTFIQCLTQAHRLVPWEPYYPYQLGWVLGNLSLEAKDIQSQQVLMQQGIRWLNQGLRVSPNQEFGHTNLAWLHLVREPRAAAQSFARSAQLVPAKRGVFYGLGLSLLAQGNRNLALRALALEAVRDPVLMTSPLWKLPELQALYVPLLQRLEQDYTNLLNRTDFPPAVRTQLHQSRGALRWWRGDWVAARADLETHGTPLAQLVLALAEGKPVQPQLTALIPSLDPLESTDATTSGVLTLAAWLNPNQRLPYLQKAWIAATRQPPPADTLNEWVASMNQSVTFDQWLKQNAPSRQYRRERLSFGIVSRHADGPVPIDYQTVVENIPMVDFFAAVMPSVVYAPEFDAALQRDREALIQQVLPSGIAK